MNQDVFELILEYKCDLDDTQACIDLMKDNYGHLIDLAFDRFSDVTEFMALLQKEIPPSLFLCLENRCPQCNDLENGHFTYIDYSPLTVGVLVEFIRHLKKTGVLCEHEIIQSFHFSNILTLIKLNGSREAIQKAQTKFEAKFD